MKTTKELAALVEAAPDWEPEVDIHLGYRGAGDACQAKLLGALDRPTLRHLIAAADALTTIATTAGLPADASAEEVAKRVRSMLAVVTYQLEMDCSYGDACPAGTNHGRCDGCRAREAMGLPASIEGTCENVLIAEEASGG